MRYLFGFLCVCALGVMPLVGCGETAGTGGSGGSAGSGGTGGIDLCEGAADGTACSDGACLNGACTALVAVEGIVFLYEGSDPEPPAVDATVSVHGTSLSTTTDEDGGFSFDVFMGDWFFQTSKEDTWGFFQLETVPTAGRNDLDLAVAADALAAQLAEDLDIAIDDTKGLVSLTFLGTASGEGGETATLSEQYEHASATNANGVEVLSKKLLPQGGYELLFYNVDLTEELTVIPRGVQGVNACTLRVPGTLYPVRAKFATSVGAVCTPVP